MWRNEKHTFVDCDCIGSNGKIIVEGHYRQIVADQKVFVHG